jgi:hypothetical protein
MAQTQVIMTRAAPRAPSGRACRGVPKPPLLSVLEGRHGLQGVFGRVRQHDPPLAVLETADGDRHLAFAEAQEPPDANDGIAERFPTATTHIIPISTAVTVCRISTLLDCRRSDGGGDEGAP